VQNHHLACFGIKAEARSKVPVATQLVPTDQNSGMPKPAHTFQIGQQVYHPARTPFLA